MRYSKFKIEDDFIVIERVFSTDDVINLSFDTDIQIKTDNSGSHYFTYGALLYALPIKAKEIVGKHYKPNFTDFTYEPLSQTKYTFKNRQKTKYKNGKIETKFINQDTNKLEKVELIPIGKTILRQVTF